VSNAGQFRFINRELKLEKWGQTNEEAQFLESMGEVTEGFADLLGIPPHLLAKTDKQTSWGTGVAEQNTGLSRYTLTRYSNAVESALRWFLPRGQYLEVDYKGLLAGTPAEEIRLLLEETGAPILEVDEAREKINLPPMEVVLNGAAQDV
jgi:HK97 family phage portal protein